MSTRTPRLEPDWKPEQLGRKEQRHAKTYCIKNTTPSQITFPQFFRYFSLLFQLSRSCLSKPWDPWACSLCPSYHTWPSAFRTGPRAVWCRCASLNALPRTLPQRCGALLQWPGPWSSASLFLRFTWKVTVSDVGNGNHQKNIQSLEALGELAEEHSVTLSRLNIWWVKSTCVKGECEHNGWKLRN